MRRRTEEEMATTNTNAESARLYLESRLWPNGPVCPVCNSGERVVALERAGFYRCNGCRENGTDEVFTVRSGTIFERSKIPLDGWMQAIALYVDSMDVSCAAIAEALNVTLKSAWLVRSKIKAALPTGCPQRELAIRKILAYKPKPKSRAARRRMKRAANNS